MANSVLYLDMINNNAFDKYDFEMFYIFSLIQHWAADIDKHVKNGINHTDINFMIVENIYKYVLDLRKSYAEHKYPLTNYVEFCVKHYSMLKCLSFLERSNLFISWVMIKKNK